ncbi:MAG TPA: hypothetical protein DCS89_05765 [Gammaproteobacteria bacterium]|jgi:uncharacterized protein (UPF0261 family)|nr:hypothetical protein [Gammaproteobacteria bacterium]HAT26499.1 hypothetical protein [Gammaproteobacteria bacterium]
MSHTVVVLATLDTKSEEADYLRTQIESLGGTALIMDMGVIGEAHTRADVGRIEVAAAADEDLAVLLDNATRESVGPIMVTGATRLLLQLIEQGKAQAVLGIGGTQGTSSCTQVMQSLPYGFPKLMVSTVASGDTAPFVGIKDITMMFSVSDLLGLNSFTQRILANAAAAAYGMSLVEGAAQSEVPADDNDAKNNNRPLIAMTNLGVLTEGATYAIELFRQAGYEVVVFHAVGSGGRAMEQLMREGVVKAVFDYALGEIADDVYGGLRAGGPERLTVAGSLGLPQVICPGGAEHLGLFVEPNVVPAKYEAHRYVFHSPVIFVPRLNREEFVRVAEEICARMRSTTKNAVFMLPLQGVGRYSIPGGPLHDPEGDSAFFEKLKAGLPSSIEIVEMDAGAEDPVFVEEAVKRLVNMLDATLG